MMFTTSCHRFHGDKIVLFDGVDLEDYLHRPDSKNLLIEMGVVEHYLHQFGPAILTLLIQLGPEYRSFLKFSNGLRTADSRCSLMGVPMNAHVDSLYKPTSLFTCNLLEKQIKRRDGEVFIGSLNYSSRRVFLDIPTQGIKVRNVGQTIEDSCHSSIVHFLHEHLPELEFHIQ